MAFRDHLLKSWQHPTLLSFVLWPLSLLYRLVFFVRSKCYQWGVFSSYRPPVPVIVVGNLTVGGTGKTPLVIFLVDTLRQLGYQPGVISRGYHGNAPSYPFSVDKDTPVLQSGDEPALIVKRTGVPMVVGPDRQANIEQLLSEHSVNIIISDDGLQHLALQRDIELCLLDKTTETSNTYLLPSGPYREPLSRLKTVDLIIEHCQQCDIAQDQSSNKCFSMFLKASAPKTVAETEQSDFDASKMIHAVAGIGNPQRFFTTCEQLGLQFETHSFPDHHQFQPQDFEFADQRPVLMTEKDAVKCNGFNTDNLWYLPVDAELSTGFSEALSKLLQDKTAC